MVPGEEVILTDHKPDVSEVQSGDGVGRRLSKTLKMGKKFVTVSDFSIINFLTSSNLLSGIAHPSTGDDKQTLERMLKTAAALNLVLQGRGAYSASAE